MRRLPILLLALAACSSSLNPDLFVLSVPEGQICSDVIEPPLVEDVTHTEDEFGLNHNTDPPTSGRHFPAPIDAGQAYAVPIPDGTLVHNLEHGHVIIHHDGARSDEQVDLLIAALAADPRSVVLAPREQEWAVSLTAWGRVQVCRDFPEDALGLVRSFVEAYRGSDLAPEGSLA